MDAGMPQGSYLGPLTFITLVDSLQASCMTQICWWHDAVQDRCQVSIPASITSQIYCDEVVQQSEQARMNINARRRRCRSAPLPKTYRYISCFMVQQLIEWQHSSCLGFMCPVISSEQITLMLWCPMLQHIFISWSSWIEPVLQSKICCTSTQR